MPQDPHVLVLKIEGLSAGQIPLTLLADKLQAAQRLLLNIGSAIRGGGRRGAWRAEVLQGCTLVFSDSRPGSLEVFTRLASPLPGLLQPAQELGVEALARTGLTLKAIKEKDRPTLEKFFPDFGHRRNSSRTNRTRRIMRRTKNCLPSIANCTLTWGAAKIM